MLLVRYAYRMWCKWQIAPLAIFSVFGLRRRRRYTNIMEWGGYPYPNIFTHLLRRAERAPGPETERRAHVVQTVDARGTGLDVQRGARRMPVAWRRVTERRIAALDRCAVVCPCE